MYLESCSCTIARWMHLLNPMLSPPSGMAYTPHCSSMCPPGRWWVTMCMVCMPTPGGTARTPPTCCSILVGMCTGLARTSQTAPTSGLGIGQGACLRPGSTGCPLGMASTPLGSLGHPQRPGGTPGRTLLSQGGTRIGIWRTPRSAPVAPLSSCWMGMGCTMNHPCRCPVGMQMCSLTRTLRRRRRWLVLWMGSSSSTCRRGRTGPMGRDNTS